MGLTSRLEIHPPAFYRMLYPHALWRVPTMERHVYLTFDDGPSPQVTPHILDILQRHNARATFFMVGENAFRHPELVEQVLAHGHSVGNHTMHHTQGRHTTLGQYLDDVEAEASLLNTRLFRPPHGLMRREQYKELQKQYEIVMFDIVTRDYDSRVTPQQILENVKRYTRPGSIIVFHDSLKASPRTQNALEPVLQWLKQQNYECRSLPMDGKL